MDKRKFNRAAKDASQLQQFVDEACDAIGGSQDSLHITVKDTDGDEAATFDVYYDKFDELSYVKFDSHRDAGTVTFDSCGYATFRYGTYYIVFDPETSNLFVANGTNEATYHFMAANVDDSERNGNVMIAQSTAKEWVLGAQEDQLTLNSCVYQVVKIDLTNLNSNRLSIAFPTKTLAVEWNNGINNNIDTFYKDEQSNVFMLQLSTNVSIAQLGYIIVDLTNPLIAHVYAYAEI